MKVQELELQHSNEKLRKEIIHGALQFANYLIDYYKCILNDDYLYPEFKTSTSSATSPIFDKDKLSQAAVRLFLQLLDINKPTSPTELVIYVKNKPLPNENDPGLEHHCDDYHFYNFYKLKELTI